ncbi:MAG TPA: exonuclease [Rhodobacteraceae bacterium]|nr:exonuclease [Paracoccaceae bacterium]
MTWITVCDAEFLTAPGAPQRFWCGPHGPDPLTVQIGAVRLSLDPPFALPRPEGWLVRPIDRDGRRVPLDPLVTRLTGLTEARIDSEGLPLTEALAALDRYSEGSVLYAWGKDELLTFAAALFVQEAPCPIPARRFRSAVPLLPRAGEPAEVVETLRSHTICAHFGLPEQGPAHDASGDALSVASVLQHLLRAGRLAPTDFATT